MKPVILAVTVLALIFLLLATIFFAVDETEFIIVTQFGRPIGDPITAPGLRWKLPIQTTISLDKRLQMYDPRPSEFLTRDKKNIVVDTFVCWKIDEADPMKFFVTVADKIGAEMRLHDIVWAELSAELGKHDLSDLVTVEEEKKFAAVMTTVTESCAEKALNDYGIEMIDVRIKRMNFPQQNKQSVFERMRAERYREAKKWRAEGSEEALKIRAQADKRATEIRSEAYKEAEKVKGQGESEAIRIYAEAYSQDPEFYKLLRTLEAYKKFLNDKTTVILSSDSELLKLLTQRKIELPAEVRNDRSDVEGSDGNGPKDEK